MQYLYIHTNDMLRKVIDSARNLLVSQIYLPKKKERKKETRNRQHEGKMVEMEDTTRDILMKIRGKRISSIIPLGGGIRGGTIEISASRWSPVINRIVSDPLD